MLRFAGSVLDQRPKEISAPKYKYPYFHISDTFRSLGRVSAVTYPFRAGLQQFDIHSAVSIHICSDMGSPYLRWLNYSIRQQQKK